MGKKAKENKNYFSTVEEEAVIRYNLESTSRAEKNEIFSKVLYKPLSKLVEIVVKKYSTFIGNCGMEELEAMAFDFVYQSMDKFYPYIIQFQRPDMEKPKNSKEHRYYFIEEAQEALRILNEEDVDGTIYTMRTYKAYSYFGTICKNYVTNHGKTQYKIESNVDELSISMKAINNNSQYHYEIDDILDDNTYENLYDNIIKSIQNEITSNYRLKENDIKVGESLILIFNNWEAISMENENSNNNFFTKKKIYQILKDMTALDANEITMALKHYKALYAFVKADNKYV